MTDNALATWDFRGNAEGFTYQQVKNALSAVAKHYCFQLEMSDGGYLHFQGRMSLIKKRRSSEKHIILKLFNEWCPNYLAPTTIDCKGDLFYVMKTDTREAGPWTDKDEETYIPRHYRNITLYPYQQEILDSAKEFNDRTINLIVDKRGSNGKSTVASLAELMYGGIDMPPLNDFKEIIALACNICMDRKLRDPKIMFFDMPRAIRKDQLYGFFSAIEQIKKGKLYDCRYHYKCWWIDSPVIWVFTNTFPDLSLLSMDRWIIWDIRDGKLVKYTDADYIYNPLHEAFI